MSNVSPNEVDELLPFYVNGTLSDEECAVVEEALANALSLRDEAIELAEMRRRMQALPSAASPGEFGLERLRRDIDRLERRKNWRLKAGLAAAAVVAVLAVSLAFNMHASQPYYVQASSGTNVETIAVTFVPEATESAIRALLLHDGLSVVDGPSALGVYHLKPEGTKSPKAALELLRKQAGIIESATFADD